MRNPSTSTDQTSIRRWLSEVKLERFKAAFAPPSIALQPFNVVVGRNGSGKSTLLEALQWISTTIRRDAREASDRYFGTKDLINLRSQSGLYFVIKLTWSSSHGPPLRYRVRVDDVHGKPRIASEDLYLVGTRGRAIRRFIQTRGGVRAVVANPIGKSELLIKEPDRLALGVLSATELAASEPWLDYLVDYWSRAVFLRLSPNRLANGSPATRRSFEPLLDEEGQTLPALLTELTPSQRSELVSAIQTVLPGIRDVTVSEAEQGRDTLVNYRLLERMPYRGRSGRTQFPIPAWMLSEGTRRITALLALLVRRPPPTLLCIEEIENGLDPWTVIQMLFHLEGASDLGTQVILTTHSPWLLDHVDIDSIIQVRRTDGDTKYERFADRAAIKAYQDNVPAGTRFVQESE